MTLHADDSVQHKLPRGNKTKYEELLEKRIKLQNRAQLPMKDQPLQSAIKDVFKNVKGIWVL